MPLPKLSVAAKALIPVMLTTDPPARIDTSSVLVGTAQALHPPAGLQFPAPPFHTQVAADAAEGKANSAMAEAEIARRRLVARTVMTFSPKEVIS